ncbi:MAG: RNA polymerase sigma factor RpoD, partial [Nitrospirota bacterium]|nr:RNA polymerase sigma factor RpoD [Nitrospirota bacterium]
VKLPPNKTSSDGSVQDLLRNSPVLKRLVAQARERGVVSIDQINAALPDEEVSPDQVDDLIAVFEDMGVNVERGSEANGSADAKTEDGEADSPASVEDEDLGRTDDPVRMYLREMGSIELLSREGEIEIAKRIEAGRNTVLETLCESPLTMRAIIGWRDAIGEGKVLLRDVIDLDATYGGAPQGAAVATAVGGPQGAPALGAPQAATVDTAVSAGASDEAAPNQEAKAPSQESSAPSQETKEKSEAGDGTAAEGEDAEGDEDDFDETALSLSAMEASVKEAVLATFDQIAEAYERLRGLQEQRLDAVQRNEPPDVELDAAYERARSEVVELVNQVEFHANRVESLVEQLYTLNRRLNGLEGKLLRLADSCAINRRTFLKRYRGEELDPEWLARVAELPDTGWATFVERHGEAAGSLRSEIATIASGTGLHIGELRRIVGLVQKG